MTNTAKTETPTQRSRRIAKSYGFEMTIGAGTDVFTRQNVIVSREGLSHGITVDGVRQPSVCSGLDNALMVACRYLADPTR
jgi:hypothetical protein